jgi:hypothetical protein
MSIFTFLSPAAVLSGSSKDAVVGAGSKALLVWALLWCMSLLIDPQCLASMGLSFNAHGHQHVHAHGHPFVDARSMFGIPNTFDVLSNLPMLVVGLIGLWRLLPIRGVISDAMASADPRNALYEKPARLAFAGLALTCLGSSLYHWHPVPATLALDRMGMAVTFAGVLAWAVAERLQVIWAFRFALVVMVAGGVSVALSLWSGHVLPWAVLQFGGLALVLVHAVVTVREGTLTGLCKVKWLALVVLYVLAKWLEVQDEQIFLWTRERISGHTLKHLAAALAMVPLVLSLTNAVKMPIQKAQLKNAI